MKKIIDGKSKKNDTHEGTKQSSWEMIFALG